jgi:quinohemoprotein ethanol dehydrogenase
VVNLGVEVPDIPEDPKALAQLKGMWKGRLLAWDPVAKKAAWVQEYPNAWNGGTLSTAGNLVFQGTADGRAVAYSADKGARLWESGLNSGAMAGPITYEVGGEQYVSFMVGWGGAFPLITGPIAPKVRPEARVVTFKLGGKLALPAPQAMTVALPPLQPLKASPDQLKLAREMFNGTCGSCHGMNAVSGGVVPDLRYLTPDKHEMFAAILSGARINKGMPAFNAALKPEDMELLRQFIIKRSHDLDAELKNK